MGHQSKTVDFNRLGMNGPAFSGKLCVLGEADKAENDSLCRWQPRGGGECRGTRNAGPQLGLTVLAKKQENMNEGHRCGKTQGQGLSRQSRSMCRAW